MIAVKHTYIRQFVVIVGISLVTTLALLGWGMLIHLHGLALLPTPVHADPGSGSTCATTHGMQQALCERQNPMLQGCSADAETLQIQTTFQKNVPLGEVELRYSPTCRTYWVRTTAFPTSMGLFKTIRASILFQNGIQEDITAILEFTEYPSGFVIWTDMRSGVLAGNTATGSFTLVGQDQPITFAFQE